MHICTFWGYKCYFSGYSETILSLYVGMRNLFLNVVFGGLISNS